MEFARSNCFFVALIFLTKFRWKISIIEVANLTFLFQIHLTSKQHKDNALIIGDFVDFCDVRNVSPVTCSVDDLVFYLEAAFVRSKHLKSKDLFRPSINKVRPTFKNQLSLSLNQIFLCTKLRRYWFWHVPFRSFYRSGRFFFIRKERKYRKVPVLYRYRPEKTGTIPFLYRSIPLQYWSFIKEQYLKDITLVLFFIRTGI